MPKVINVSLVGRSGCGKGTQAKLLMERFGNFFYISTGDLLRELGRTGTETGKKIKEVLDEGGLPFDDMATTLWMHAISFNVKEGQGIIFDGAPRRLQEAIDMVEFMTWLGRANSTFYILLDISRQEAFDRLTKRRICKDCERLIPWVGEFKKLEKCDKCGGELVTRPDDKPEAINNRLNFYEERVMEVVDFFSKKNLLIRINGEQPIEDVFRDILKALGEKQ